MLKKLRFSAFQWYQLMRYAGLVGCAMLLPHRGFDPSSIARFESLLYYTGLLSFFWVGGVMNRFVKYDGNETLPLYTGKFAAAQLIYTTTAAAVLFLLHCIHPIQDFYLIFLYFLFNTPLFITEHYLLLKKDHTTLISYGVLTALIPIVSSLLSDSINSLLLYLVILSAIKGIAVHFYFQQIAPWWRQYGISSILQNSKQILWESAPFAGAILAAGAADYIDGFLVKHYFDDASFSIYRYGAREIPYVLILANALSLGMIPAFKDSAENGMMILKSKSHLLLHISFPVAILCMIFSDQLFEWVFTRSFAGSSIIFQTYLLLLIPRLIFPQTILQAKDEGGTIFTIAILELIINVAASMMLMQWFGLIGIAMGTFVAFCFDKFALAMVLKFKHGISPAEYCPWMTWGFYSLLLTGIFLFQHRHLFF